MAQRLMAGKKRDTVYWPNARPNQRPPEGDWRFWLLLAGRGFGKSRTIVEWAHWQAMTRPGTRGNIVGATGSDVRDILVNGESGFLNVIAEDERPRYKPSELTLLWPNGSMALLFSADEPNRLRGKQCHWAIADELAAWRYPAAWDQLLFGLRLGNDPRAAIATTPRPTKLIRSLVKDATCHVTRGSTYDNKANLASQFYTDIINRYEGTRLGRQELNAEILEDVEGALWKQDAIDNNRVTEARVFTRIVIGVDPKASAEADSETGIIVMGLGQDGRGYVIADYSIDGTPEQWAQRVAYAYEQHSADRVVVEVNQGGDMVSSVLRATGVRLPIQTVRASRGKYTRAEPIAALYEQGKVVHVGVHSALEDQLCTWTPGDSSPDRLDALCWAAWALMLDGQSQRPRVREY